MVDETASAAVAMRRRNLMRACNQLRQLVLTLLDVAQDAYGAIDSLPVPTGAVSEPLAASLASQRTPLPAPVTRLITRFRQISETVNGQLGEQFAIAQNDAHSLWGLCARLYTKPTASPSPPQPPLPHAGEGESSAARRG